MEETASPWGLWEDVTKQVAAMQSDGEHARRTGETSMQGTGDILCEEWVAGKALGCWREGWNGRPGGQEEPAPLEDLACSRHSQVLCA